MIDEHVILVAVSVTVPRGELSRERAELWLHQRLNEPAFRGPNGDDEQAHVDSWWVAEDDRLDGSDTDAAVFVVPGKQAEAVRLLRLTGWLTSTEVEEGTCAPPRSAP